MMVMRGFLLTLTFGLLATGPSLAADPALPYGGWSGTLTCKGGVRQLNLQISAKPDGDLQGVLSYGDTLASADDSSAGWIRISGRATNGTVRLNALDWITPSLGRPLISLEGTQDRDQAGHDRITGTATGQDCTRFELRFDEIQFDLEP